ncbi:MAG: tetratricopeptide repeat protein, partial [Cyanobacteria bacterium]|nr:tetratricopeptide repeat protein [Cyanobacteriota bacterium]
TAMNTVDTSWWNQPSPANSTVRKPGRPERSNDLTYDTSTALDEVPPSMVLTQCPIELSDAINEARLEADLIRQVSGSYDPTLADCLTKLADLYCRSKRYRDMEPLLLEALSIREARYGSGHQLVATSLKNLARLYYFVGKYHRAQPLFERALSIRRRIYGSKHAKVADILEQYAKLLEKTGITEDADAMIKEATAIRRMRNSWTAF